MVAGHKILLGKTCSSPCINPKPPTPPLLTSASSCLSLIVPGLSIQFSHSLTRIYKMARDIPSSFTSTSSGIKVIVVGLGLAGLTTAIECRRKGHSVIVLDRITQLKHDGM
jgi:hypothetical protein